MKRILLCIMLAMLLPWALADEAEPCQHAHTYNRKETIDLCNGPIIEYIYCSDCGELLTTNELPGQGHDYDWSVAEPGTCVKDSVIRYVCVNCGHEEYGTHGTDKNNHNFGDWYVVQEATPYSYGTKERKCRDCGATEQDSVAYVCPGHNYQVVIDEPATPYYPGRYRLVCSICGDGDIHTITYNYGEYPTELQGGMVTRTPPPTKPGQTPSPSPQPTPTAGSTQQTMAPSATPKPQATTVPVTATPQSIAPQNTPAPVTLNQLQRMTMRDVSAAGLHGVTVGADAAQAVAAIGTALAGEASAGNTRLAIVGLNDLLTANENAACDQLNFDQQLMLTCHLLGMDDMLADDAIEPQTMALMSAVSSRIHGMTRAEEGAYLVAQMERFPMNMVTVNGSRVFASIINIAVQSGSAVRVEQYGFHRSPAGWMIAYIGTN